MHDMTTKQLATHDGVFFLFDDMRLYIRIDTNTITDEGLDHLSAAMDDVSPTNPISLHLNAHEWQMRENLTFDDVKLRLTELRESPSSRYMAKRYRAASKPLGTADQPGSQRIGDLFSIVDARNGLIDNDTLRAVDATGLSGRIILLEVHSPHQIVFKHIGADHARRFGDDWPKQALGTATHNDQPDAEYSDWVHKHYIDTLENGARRDFIDAIIDVHRPGAQPVRSQYDRLLQPVRYANGADGLLVVSEVMPRLLPLAS